MAERPATSPTPPLAGAAAASGSAPAAASSSSSSSNSAVVAESSVQELADARRDGYVVGDVLDVLDTVRRWMEGRVVQVDPKKGYLINYLGWSEKWNEWVPAKSGRIAPYRSYTTKSTAPSTNAGAYQLEGDNMVKFRACAAKLPAILAKAKARAESKEPLMTQKQREQQAATYAALVSVAVAQGAAPPPEPALDSKTEFAESEWLYITNELQATVNNVLNSVVSELTAVPDAAKLLADFLLLCTYLLKSERDVKPATLEVMVRALNSDPLSPGEKRFYTKYGVAGTETGDNCTKGKWAVRPKPTGSGDSLKVVSAYLIYNINLFGDAGGFDLIAKKIATEGDAAPSFLALGHFANLLRGLEGWFEPKMIKKFIPSLKWDIRVILAKLASMTDDELKLLSRDGLRHMMRNINELILQSKEIKHQKEAADRLQLAIILRLLQSDILEKRINALLDLADVIKYLRACGGAKAGTFNLTVKQQSDRDLLPACFTSHKSFLEWVEQAKLMQLILSAEAHEEIVRRAGPVLKYLASCNALSVEPIFLMFDSVLSVGGGVQKHESFVRIVFDLMSDLSSELSDATLDALIARLNSLPKSCYTEMYLKFLKNFALCCSRANPVRAQGPLRTFWDLISVEQSDVSQEMCQFALQLLSELLAMPQFEAQRIPYVELCIKGLASPTAPTVSILHLLTNILQTFPQQSDAATWNKPQLILALDGTMKLFKILFEQFEAYHKLAQAAVTAARANLTEEEQQQQIQEPTLDVRMGANLHSEHVAARLEFLWYVLQQAPKLVLPISCLDVLWRLLHREGVLSSDRIQLYQWLERLVNDGSELNANGTRQRHFSCLRDDAMKHMFQLLTSNADMARITPEGYHCFELYFCYCNFLQGCLVHPSRRFLQLLSFESMLGLEALWNMASLATDKKVVITSRFTVVALYTKMDAKLARKRSDIYRLFLDRCLESIDMHRTAILAQNNTVFSQRVCLQLLMLLDAFILACDKLFHAQEEAAVAAAANPASPVSPPPAIVPVDAAFSFHRHLLSNHQAFFNRLFDLLALGGEIATRVWNLLIKLPTNEEMHQRIAAVPQAVADKPDAPVEWSSLLSSDSTVKLLYTLQLVHSHLRSQEDEDARAVEAWSQVFLTHGGFAYAYSLLLAQDLNVMVSDDALNQQCLASLLRLLNTFMAFSPGSQPALLTDAVIDYAKLIHLLIAIIERAVSTAHVDREPEVVAAAGADAEAKQPRGLLLYAFQLLAMCLSRLPAESPLLQLVPAHEQWDAILQSGLLEHPSHFLREATASGIDLLCSEPILTPIETAPPAAPIAQILTGFFFPRLLALLPRIDTRSVQASSFFKIACKLLHSARVYSVPIDYASLLSHLLLQVQQHPILEVRNTDDDHVLRGWFNLLAELLRQQPQFKESCQQLVQTVYDCLFTLPVPNNPVQESSAVAVPSVPPPMCKSTSSRRAAFLLLEVLVYDCPANLLQLVGLLRSLHLCSHSGGQAPHEFDFESKADEKSECGYVGLRNLGSICYLNSTVQQFFMIPAFRQQLLAAQPSAEEAANPKTSVLFQLQSIMAFLQESEKQSFDPQGLCSSFVDFDGNPLNVGVQEDAASFVTRLIDKVMESAAKSPAGAGLKAAIYGQTVDQFIGHAPRCTHYRERAEEFATIGLKVRNMKTIQDSLKSFVQGEVMDGNNAYKCSQCDAKVDTTKRTVFNTLPPTLIFNLIRFEMDFNSMRTFKINDRIEFPAVLNMKPYTKEGIAEQERASKAAADGVDAKSIELPATPEHPDSYYEYELSGVTVHTGSMDRGHYYSFIQEPQTPQQIKDGVQGKWVEFNDTVVRPFDPRNIDAECFGGTERIQQFAANGRPAGEATVEKQRNAYLLFYTSKRKYTEQANVPSPSNAAASSSSSAAAAVSSVALTAKPKAAIPAPIYESVWHSNLTYWHDRFVFDSMYHEWMWEVMNSAQGWIQAAVNHAHSQQDGQKVAQLEALHTSATELATRFVLETLCRARHKQRLLDWSSLLSNAYRMGDSACRWLLHAMTVSHSWNIELLLSCPIVEVRQALAALLCEIIVKMAPAEEAVIRARAVVAVQPAAELEIVGAGVAAVVPEPADGGYVCSYIDSLVSLLRVVPQWWRRFDQYFRVLLEFSRVSPAATQYLLTRHNLLARLCDMYLGDASPLANPYGMPVFAGKRAVVGDTLVRPDMTSFLGLLSRLVCASVITQGVLPPTAISEQLLPLSADAQAILFSKPLLGRLLTDATSRKRGSYIASLLTHMLWEQLDLSKLLIGLIVTGIKQEQVDTLRPYFRVIGAVLQVSDSLQTTRQDIMLQSLMLSMEQHAGYWSPLNFMLEHLLRLCKQQLAVCAWLNAHPAKLDWMTQWLRAHPSPPRQGEATLMHKPGRIDPITQLQNFDVHDYAAFAPPRSFPTLPYTSVQKVACFDRIRAGSSLDSRGGSDSDVELSERTFTVGEYVDVLDTVNKWLVAKIQAISEGGKSVLVHFDNWHAKYDEVLPADSIRITRFGRFSSGVIVEQQQAAPVASDAPVAAVADVDNLAASMASAAVDASPK